jgi:DNA-binding PadR family transcriptional regulator
MEILGPFEQAVMLAIVTLTDGAYGRRILAEVARSLDRDVAAGAVYATLDRLENKGLAVSVLADATPDRGGRAKRYFRLTGQGIATLNGTRAAMDRMWSLAPWPLPEGN